MNNLTFEDKLELMKVLYLWMRLILDPDLDLFEVVCLDGCVWFSLCGADLVAVMIFGAGLLMMFCGFCFGKWLV